MAEKKTQLSVIIRAVDRATAVVKGISARLDAATKPIRDFKEALGDLREKSGLDDVIGGFKGVGSAVAGVVAKVAVVGGVVAVAVAGLLSLVDSYDQLGDKAEAIGVSVDFLAQMRYAAERSGAAVDSLDSGLQTFSVSLGMARAGTGKMAKFLGLVSPALLKQVKAAKSNEEAFDLLAAAAAKIVDPAKRAAFAQKTLGDASLAPLLGRGAKGIKELRDRYAQLAPEQGEAAKAAGEVDDSLKDLHASTDGIKSALLIGLAPALKVVVDRLREWLKGHRNDIKEWAVWLGERIPGAVSTLVDGIRGAIDAIRPFVDSGTKLKVILAAVAAVILGPVISSVVGLGVALLTTPVGWIIAGIAAIAAAAYEIYEHWDEIAGFFSDLWDGIVEAFEAAWGRIKAIVDLVIEAAKAVVDAVASIGSSVMDVQEKYKLAHPELDVSGQASAPAANTISGSSSAKITVDFANAPKGTRVKTDPQGTADVDLSVGYQMGGTP